jgi:hypothetical protein
VTHFDFADYLDLADDLATRSDEAAWRAAISRAYYAVFGVAWRTLPPALQMHVGQGRVHRATWVRYAGSSLLPCRQIGGIGFRLRQVRELADYDATSSFTLRRVQTVLREARQTLQLLDRHGYQP